MFPSNYGKKIAKQVKISTIFDSFLSWIDLLYQNVFELKNILILILIFRLNVFYNNCLILNYFYCVKDLNNYKKQMYY